MDRAFTGVKGTSVTRNILVVDDDQDVRTLMVLALKRAGHSVHAVGSPYAALAHVDAANTFDLLITDFQMPLMNGYDLYRNLLQRLPELQVLFVSGTMYELESILEQPDMYEKLEKPFRASDLLAKVNGLLEMPA